MNFSQYILAYKSEHVSAFSIEKSVCYNRVLACLGESQLHFMDTHQLFFELLVGGYLSMAKRLLPIFNSFYSCCIMH